MAWFELPFLLRMERQCPKRCRWCGSVSWRKLGQRYWPTARLSSPVDRSLAGMLMSTRPDCSVFLVPATRWVVPNTRFSSSHPVETIAMRNKSSKKANNETIHINYCHSCEGNKNRVENYSPLKGRKTKDDQLLLTKSKWNHSNLIKIEWTSKKWLNSLSAVITHQSWIKFWETVNLIISKKVKYMQPIEKKKDC